VFLGCSQCFYSYTIYIFCGSLGMYLVYWLLKFLSLFFFIFF